MTRIGLRRVWFQIHKWIGLILALPIVLLCLTGSALVWHDAMDRALSPQRYAVSGGAQLAPQVYARAAQAALGRQPIATLTLPARAGDPVIASGAPQPTRVQGPSPRTTVYLDPPSARVLEVSNSRSGPVMVMHMLHGTFAVPGIGRPLVGWVGVAMLVSSVSGLWLWWPTVGRWTRGLRWRRHRNLDTNLHHLLGFWIALPLFVLSLTGAWISFPGFFGPLVGENGRAMGYGPERMAMLHAQTLASQHLALADVLARARAVAPGPVAAITWPTTYKTRWLVTVRAPGKPVTVAVSDRDGSAAPTAAVDMGAAKTGQWMRRLHDGIGMGLVWQVVIFLGGLLPATLAVTGLVMWWRARRWRAALARRQVERIAA